MVWWLVIYTLFYALVTSVTSEKLFFTADPQPPTVFLQKTAKGRKLLPPTHQEKKALVTGHWSHTHNYLNIYF